MVRMVYSEKPTKIKLHFYFTYKQNARHTCILTLSNSVIAPRWGGGALKFKQQWGAPYHSEVNQFNVVTAPIIYRNLQHTNYSRGPYITQCKGEEEGRGNAL